MKLQNIILSEATHMQKDKCHMLLLILNFESLDLCVPTEPRKLEMDHW